MTSNNFFETFAKVTNPDFLCPR